MPEMTTRGNSSRLLWTALIYGPPRKPGEASTFVGISDWLLCRPLARALVHRHGQLHADVGVHVSRRPSSGVWQAEPPQPALGAVLRLWRDIGVALPAVQ